MPLPVLHGFAGYAIYKAARPQGARFSRSFAILLAFLGILPDFDFLPGILAHQAALYHRVAAHSIAGAFIIGAVCTLVIMLIRKYRRPIFEGMTYGSIFLLTSLATASHAILDYLGGPPKGIALFWPVTDKMFYLPFSIYGGKGSRSALDDASGLHDFLSYTFSGRCFYSFIYEIMIVVACLTLYRFTKALRQHTPAYEPITFATLAVTFAWAMHRFFG